MTAHENNTTSDVYNLSRFLIAQEEIYPIAFAELMRGRKETHWMWFIFPQIDGLGHSPTAKRFAIKTAGEAKAYLEHPILGARLRECCEAVVHAEGRTVSEMFGSPDDTKLRSSMTLFAAVAVDDDSVFTRVLRKHFGGIPDQSTISILRGGA